MNAKRWAVAAGIVAAFGGAAAVSMAGENTGSMQGMMGGRGTMGGGGAMGCPMMSGGGMGGMMGGGMMGGGARGGLPTLPPGNEKLQVQMQAEIMQKVGEIMAKYAGQIETR